MKKNYYDILQINRNASPEIIEKAYKILAKKYHPDLQTGENKKHYEEILKEINEAYEVLSNPEKKKTYDNSLQDFNISEQDYNDLYKQNELLRNELNNIKKNKYNNLGNPSNINNINNNYSSNIDNNISEQYKKQLNEEIQKASQKAYYDAYINDLKNRGYKIKYKKTLHDRFKDLLAFIILIAIFIFIWQIPFVHNYFIDLYNEHIIIRLLVDPILNIFK